MNWAVNAKGAKVAATKRDNVVADLPKVALVIPVGGISGYIITLRPMECIAMGKCLLGFQLRPLLNPTLKLRVGRISKQVDE